MTKLWHGYCNREVQMNHAQQIIPRLRQPNDLEGTQSLLKKKNAPRATLATEIDSLRALLPTSILHHHDSRKARGKTSLAPASGGVCGACHLAIPRGRLADLQRITDALNVCDHCGVFIYLAKETQPNLADLLTSAAGEPKKVARTKSLTRSRKTRHSEASPAR